MSDEYSELTTLSRRLRAAFAAGVAERVLPLYKNTAEVYSPAPKDAIKAAWSFASGEDISAETINSINRELDEAHPGPDGGGPELFSLTAAGSALDAISDETVEAARAASLEALDAVDQLGGEDGALEEREWQARALSVVKSWEGRPIDRTMFATLNQEKPQWLVRFEG